MRDFAVRIRRPRLLVAAAIVIAATAAALYPQTAAFRFVILGDRTGEAQPGVYEAVWRQAAAEKPAFVVSVGDTIQGLEDSTAEAQWKEVEALLRPYRKIPLYLAAGNHDVWSARSEALYRRYSEHPLHYGFDHGPVHFTVLDNSRRDALSAEEMEFLEKDLQEHAAQPVKFIMSHRPSWIIQAAIRNPQFPLHQLAKKFSVRYVVAGHIHQYIHVSLEGIEYVSMPSSGGHLRLSKKYEDGWFFGYAVVDVRGDAATVQIKELPPPHGEGRVIRLK